MRSRLRSPLPVASRRSHPVGRHTRLPLLIVGLLAAAALAACRTTASGPQRIPTVPLTQAGLPDDGSASTPIPSPGQVPTQDATLPPAIVLPDASGVSVACPANALRLTLTHPEGETFTTLSRIAAHEDVLYLLGDGGLYRVARADANAGNPGPEAVLVPGERIAGRPVQELTDIAIDRKRGLIYALDKAGHVFRYEIATGLKMLAYRATTDPDEPLDPQIVALEVDAAGDPILLDSALGVLWTPGQGIETLDTVNQSRGLTTGVDLASTGGRFYILLQNGTIRVVNADVGSSLWRDAEGQKLSLALTVSDHLGIDILYVVDGLRREVTGITPDDGRAVTRHAFVFPDMGLLRDAAFAGGRLYAVADADLFVYPGPDTGDETTCAPSAPGTEARPWLYGFDVLGVMHNVAFPLEGEWTLPPWPRVYPGASRLYRLGVHQGMDLYEFNGPQNFRVGWPVLAVMDGEVTRSTLAYTELDESTFEAMLAQTEALGETPPDVLTRLAGKQVIIDHGDGVRTVYSHLDEIAPGVVTGARVRAGQLIGTVGVTGTQGEVERGTVGPHLHVEIWVNEYYLGYGITIREAMWWYAQIFAEE